MTQPPRPEVLLKPGARLRDHVGVLHAAANGVAEAASVVAGDSPELEDAGRIFFPVLGAALEAAATAAALLGDAIARSGVQFDIATRTAVTS